MAFVLLVATPALAITWGQFDGDGHPNVGAMVVDVPETGWWHVCSGTLIEDDVFLTAAHCTQFAEAQELQVGVSFDPVFDPETSAIIRGTTHTHPDFGFSGPGGTSDAHDIAVIVLDEPAAGISPASLPTAGLLDQLNVGNGLKDQLFTVVGYGVQEPEFGEGPPVHPYTGERRVAVSRFLALLPSWLQLSQVDARDDGGSCFGDSGGPTFLGAGAQETDIVVSITSWGDSMCVATGTTYRVDTESARAFLAQFVTLP
ncbi:S1 family peptidase [Nitriliruptor alkaliphilus]|uniref:S1 family peptidase n=1 Tax=Nitriliruptor alkaliphilus TaxID=427918 RepID=UPI0009F85848|nr:trypsin-like serine protease [Nitriliruptor alkaliphilus]